MDLPKPHGKNDADSSDYSSDSDEDILFPGDEDKDSDMEEDLIAQQVADLVYNKENEEA